MPDPKDCRTHRILLIEQNTATCVSIESALVEAGFYVLPMEELPDPLDLDIFRPELLLMGTVTGGQNGCLDYLCELKAVPFSAGIPVLIRDRFGRWTGAATEEVWVEQVAILLQPTREPRYHYVAISEVTMDVSPYIHSPLSLGHRTEQPVDTG